jgi:nicotinate-nucleotide--dimethylbenzimidazole phosphoribosyltransferase
MIPNWRFSQSDSASAKAAYDRQQQLTKPAGSLGELERIPQQLAGVQGDPLPKSRPAEVILFASDHPVTRHGVSAYPSAVTRAMVMNFVAGGAAASVSARALGVPLTVVDVGVEGERLILPDGEHVRFVRDPVADAPVGDLRHEDAMSEETYAAALMAGVRAVDRLSPETRTVILGEMGIGNTTPAAAVSAALLGASPRELVGPGTGVVGEALERKFCVVEDAVARVGYVSSPHEIMRRLGGRELAALMGAAARAIETRRVVLVDGFIVSASILCLVKLDPAARSALIFAHQSQEPGHRRVLAALDARPLLDLGLRLGEGSGALTALPLLDLACALHSQMATFASAAVPGKEQA